MSDQQQDKPVVLPHGLNSLIVRFGLKARPDLTAAVRAFEAELTGDPIAGVTQIAGSLATVLVEFDPNVGVRSVIASELADRLALRDWTKVTPAPPLRRWTIPVAFGGEAGPQFAETARLSGQSEEAAVAEICAQDLDVLCFGFAPGQAYLGFLPETWNIPRLPELSPNVPSGALILAIRQLILFAKDNPTGWRHIGQSGFRPFELLRDPSILLKPRDVLRFTPISALELEMIEKDNADGLGHARLEVLT